MPSLIFKPFAELALLTGIADRAKDTKSITVQWAAYLKAAIKRQVDELAPPLAAATVAKQTHTGTGAVTAAARVRASYAKQLDTKLKRKGADAARADLRALLTGDLSQGQSGNKTVGSLRRRLLRAQQAKAAGGKVATGKKKIEKTNGKRGGKMRNAFKAVIRGLTVFVVNQVPFSGSHDKGGKVGHGATLPAWGFTRITDEVRSELSRIATDWILHGKK